MKIYIIIIMLTISTPNEISAPKAFNKNMFPNVQNKTGKTNIEMILLNDIFFKKIS